jgi:CRISPR system Cascade subunit CasE
MAPDGLPAARVEAFRFTRLLARDHSGGRSRSQHTEGPDATITGTLVVDDPDRFSVGLARGVGRFRAFGFGMLLLSPPRG